MFAFHVGFDSVFLEWGDSDIGRLLMIKLPFDRFGIGELIVHQTNHETSPLCLHIVLYLIPGGLSTVEDMERGDPSERIVTMHR